ncbi:hypothetical protein BGZ60DRAFT_420599 [Tricladium varicosporioides]|nr:hypothetical protein BGZ60DRAFT_420599 [Hymenoscyphus varicosporioides]
MRRLMNGVGPFPFLPVPSIPFHVPTLRRTSKHEMNNSDSYNEIIADKKIDASKTPPSRFQQRKGSIFATPGSRDGHVDRNNERDAKYHEKLAEKGWGAKFRRGSKSS